MAPPAGGPMPSDPVPTLQEFYEAMSGDREPLAIVIRAAIFIEHEVIEFVQERVRNVAALDRMRLGFVARMELAIALGMSDEYREPIKVVAEIRNKFAHRPGASFDAGDANKFEVAFPQWQRDGFRRHYLRISETRQAKTFEGLSPIDKFTFMAVCLHGGIEVEREKAPK